MTALYGIIGRPLGHSFSPRYFAEKFRREGIDARYEAFELRDIGEVGTLLKEHPDLLGFNVTIPYKQAVMAWTHRLSATAAAVGAVNCVRVVRRDDGSPLLEGHNTDAAAFGESLRRFLARHPVPGFSADAWQAEEKATAHKEASAPLTDTLRWGEEEPLRALVLGNGGAACAVRHALDALGIGHLTVSRTPQGSGVIGYGDLSPALLATHPLIINATPLGTWPHTADFPPIPYPLLTPRHRLHDLVYNPPETTFMRLGQQQGAAATNGAEMLRLQAEASWAFWQSAAQ